MSPFFVACTLFLASVSAIRLDLPEGAACGEGICRRFAECPWAAQQLRRGHRPDLCSFIDREPVVCCPPVLPSSSTPVRLPLAPQQAPSNSIADQKCREYSEAVFGSRNNLRTDKCAISEPPYPLTFIVDGSNAQPMEFPHMVQLGYGHIKATASFDCGGSLISPEWVLTAAHCIKTTIGRPSWVKAGDLDVSSDKDDATPIVVAVDHSIAHPLYDMSNSFKNDIALVRLSCSLRLTPYIRPACIPSTSDLGVTQVSGRTVLVASGWGHTDYGGVPAKTLQKVRLAVVDMKSCNATFHNKLYDDVMLCAEGTNEKKTGDTCQGDSGGPLHAIPNEPYCMYSVVGVTSFGMKCGKAPGVYARVATFTPWIERIVWRNSYKKLPSCNNRDAP